MMMVEAQLETYRLTPTQEAMLIYSLYAPGSKAYFEQVCYSYEGRLDLAAFAEAWREALRRHAILRTSFAWGDSEHLAQIVHSGVVLPFEHLDWRNVPASQQQNQLDQFLQEDSDFGFDLSKPPLLRITVLQVGDEAYRIVVSNHHIILDGWSMSVVRDEVSQMYRNLTIGESTPLTPVHPFSEYVQWLCQHQSAEAEEFWRQEFAGFQPPKNLSIDNAGGKVSNPTESFVENQLTLSTELTAAIRSSARRHHLTMSTFVQGAWALLLSRYCDAQDVAFGITVSGRPYDMPGVESMVGLLINTLPVRVEVNPGESCASYLRKVQTRVAGLIEHGLSSLKDIQRWSDLPRNAPLFETLLVFENYAGCGSSFELEDAMQVVSAQLTRTNYPLALVVDPGTQLGLQVVYHRSRFADDAIERMLGHLATILGAMAEDLERPISQLPMLTDAESQTLLQEWNSDGQGVNTDEPVTRLFEQQAKIAPEALALVHDGEELSYGDLSARANQLAHYLQRQGIGPETLVGICIERSVAMVVAVLATLKAGGAYVPLDPVYPKNRLAYMLDDSGIQVLITRSDLADRLSDYEGKIVFLDSLADGQSINACSIENPVHTPDRAHLAYVIYTSGSTGKPKGTMIEHRSLSNFISAAVLAYQMTPGDRVLQFASLSFDTSVEEIFPALSVGATVVLRTDSMLSSAADFLGRCGEFGITILDLPTAYWHELARELADDNLTLPVSLRLVIIGGEKALPERLASWRRHVGDHVRLLNTYGPTETTIVATTFDLSTANALERLASSDVPIGRPLRNLTTYVLDAMMRPVPVGVPGELYIGGAGVARGYLRRPELTAEKFVLNPFASESGARLYRTGDLVCYRPDGNLEFLGRIDNQVKIRGFRVEPEEIEQAIRSDENVFDAVVLVQEEGSGDKRLIAYVVAARGAHTTVGELRSTLAQKVPAYMLPAGFLFVEAFPLMPNGKIDRKALPPLDLVRPSLDENFEAPRCHLEESIAEVWEVLLKVDRVGIHDNFFELGGHSLLGAKLISNLRRKLNVELDLVDVFQSPTVARLAALIYQRQTEEEADDDLAKLLAELETMSDEEAQERFAEELAKGGSRAQALKLTLVSTGTAALEILTSVL